MDVDVTQTAAAVVPYLTAAAHTYGMHTLDKLRDDAVDAASDAAVGVARRLAKRLFGRQESRPAIEAALGDLAATPHDVDAQAALRLQIRKALTDDPALCADIARMLADANAGVVVVASGDRSVAAHTISAPVFTGDHATIQR
jgi:hypothetical protein